MRKIIKFAFVWGILLILFSNTKFINNVKIIRNDFVQAKNLINETTNSVSELNDSIKELDNITQNN